MSWKYLVIVGIPDIPQDKTLMPLTPKQVGRYKLPFFQYVPNRVNWNKEFMKNMSCHVLIEYLLLMVDGEHAWC